MSNTKLNNAFASHMEGHNMYFAKGKIENPILNGMTTFNRIFIKRRK